MAERVSLDVIATKITPPRLGVPLVTRPRLLNQIAGAEGCRLLLLSAEAGYGKTSLLLSLRSQLDVPVAWLTLDETDANPRLLAVGLVSALRRVVPGFGENILRVLTAGPGVDAIKTQVSRAFQDLPPLLIVLDDLQVIDGNPDATALVDHLLLTLPAPVRIAAAGRVWPRLQSLPSLLVAGHVVVLDKTALAFTGEETATFLRESHGMAVEADHAQRLARRTEGWAAALQLTALALKKRRAESLEGTPREIFEYLAVAVLQRLPDAEQGFLLRTSILSELSPALCAAVAERGDAAEVLGTLDRANLFLYRLDDAGTRFRYHQLFAEFLQQQLARQGADAVAALHQRAARQLEAEGAPERAIRHYIAAGVVPARRRCGKTLVSPLSPRRFRCSSRYSRRPDPHPTPVFTAISRPLPMMLPTRLWRRRWLLTRETESASFVVRLRVATGSSSPGGERFTTSRQGNASRSEMTKSCCSSSIATCGDFEATIVRRRDVDEPHEH